MIYRIYFDDVNYCEKITGLSYLKTNRRQNNLLRIVTVDKEIFLI